ncbi:RND family efflux transporter MFP subunit [Idiomarina loihiensis]|uniref:efflux RND transporter periplasmic adaptor subunit n=1 Tax=Idiomarina TaxID=135575 RepID=UPI000D930AF9|nr:MULTISPECIES: efflux RND transporter periplasmic adaptor subunit [Idiomarina]PWW40323.1 RND family efflux transporter MFP subunit [Idiomarina loihiensis]TDP50014.1 RND family efflux transporter MFP subunit [Idiomarina loihiensis]TDS24634.1 RND family efflux transporter MFP subunit [Idiomarina sp. H2]
MKHFAKYLLAAFIALTSLTTSAADVPVYVATAETRDIAASRDFPGRVVSDSYISLSAEVSGKLTWIKELGSQVKKGEVVASVDDSLLQLARDKAAQAVVNYQSQLALARKRRDRHSVLSKENYVAQNLLDTLDEEIAQLSGLLRQANVELATKQQLLARCQIKAPFNGRITERLLKSGEWVEQSEAVLRIIDDSALEVSLRVPSTFAAGVQINEAVSVRSDVGVVAGILATKAVQLDFKYYELRVDFSDVALPAGMPVTVGFKVPGQGHPQLAVPSDALLVRNNKVGIFKIDQQQQAIYVPVYPLVVDHGWAAVEGQVSAGDTVVIRGVERLVHGQTVKILTPEMQLTSQR